jgi:isoleucyl-tRNA synthetase
VAEVVAGLEPERLRRLEAGETVTVEVDGEPCLVEPGDVVVEREVTSDWLVQSDGPFVAALDPALTEALRSEGLARELVNRVQRARKDAGYEFTTRIELWLDGAAEVLTAARVHAEAIGAETLARRVHVGARASGADLEQRLEIDGWEAVVGVRRHDDGQTTIGS